VPQHPTMPDRGSDQLQPAVAVIRWRELFSNRLSLAPLLRAGTSPTLPARLGSGRARIRDLTAPSVALNSGGIVSAAARAVNATLCRISAPPQNRLSLVAKGICRAHRTANHLPLMQVSARSPQTAIDQRQPARALVSHLRPGTNPRERFTLLRVPSAARTVAPWFARSAWLLIAGRICIPASGLVRRAVRLFVYPPTAAARTGWTTTEWTVVSQGGMPLCSSCGRLIDALRFRRLRSLS